MPSTLALSGDYWSTLQITAQDLEALQTHLFEVETPLTAGELAAVFVPFRIKVEKQLRDQQRSAAGKTYLPREQYADGQELVFPELDWSKGKVIARDGALLIPPRNHVIRQSSSLNPESRRRTYFGVTGGSATTFSCLRTISAADAQFARG